MVVVGARVAMATTAMTGVLMATTPSPSAWAGGQAALDAIAAGDCRRAGDEVNEGLARDEALAYMVAGTLYDVTGCVEGDPARAARLYRRAIELGNAEARNFLGLMYCLGRGVPQDYAQTYRWFVAPVPGAKPPPLLDEGRQRAYGYAYTVTQLARSRVRYPSPRSDEGSFVVRFNAVTREVVLLPLEAGQGRQLALMSIHASLVESAYCEAIAEAPAPGGLPETDVWFETPWTFQLR